MDPSRPALVVEAGGGGGERGEKAGDRERTRLLLVLAV